MSNFNVEKENENSISKETDLNYLPPSENTLNSEYKVRIKVFGIGGAGGNAVNNMIRAGLQGVEFFHINTDFKDLEKSLAPNKIPIGMKLTGGHGTGGDCELGEKAALEDCDQIIDALTDADIVFIAAGMGGGTGTGAASVVAAHAGSINATTIAVVTKPYSWEGPKKIEKADWGIRKLKESAATLLVILNDNLKSVLPKDMPFTESFKAADDILRQGVTGIANLINKQGLIHRDFGDIKSVLKRGGRAILGIGKAKGENRALEAVKMASNNPLLEATSMSSVDKVLLIFSECLPTIPEITIAAEHIRSITSENCEISFGTFDEKQDSDEICVTIIASSSGENEQFADTERLPKIPTITSKTNTIIPVHFEDSVLEEDINLGAEKPNSTLIRGKNSNLFGNTPSPQPKPNQKINLKYEIAQIPPTLRENTPNLLKKKEV